MYRTRHQSHEFLPRHPHAHAFAALVLSGCYVEAGDTGRHAVRPGDILIHQPWERHLDRIERGGAEVLVLDLDGVAAPFVHGRIDDPDAVARLAETDPIAARDLLLATAMEHDGWTADWPDQLAAALRADPALSIGSWANEAKLHAGSVSRSFRQVFGITPNAYRLAQRTLQALAAVRTGRASLSAVAHECRFADQAHMARAIRSATGFTARQLRK